MSIVSHPQAYRPVALTPADEALELRDFGAPDLVPAQDPDAFPPDELTEAELDALYVAEMARRDREADARQPAQSPHCNDPRPAPEPPDAPRDLDRLDAIAEAEGVALERLGEWSDRPVSAGQGYVALGWLVTTATLYGREPVGQARRTCRRRPPINKTGLSRGWEPGDDVTRTADRKARHERCQAVRLARVAALEQSDKAALTFSEAAELVGMYPDTIGKIVSAAGIPTTRVTQGLARWKIVQRDDLLRHFRRAAGL